MGGMGFDNDKTQLIYLELLPSVEVSAIYPGDENATAKSIQTFCLKSGDAAALSKLDGQRVLIAIDPDAKAANRYWPTDLSGKLYDLGGNFDLIFPK